MSDFAKRAAAILLLGYAENSSSYDKDRALNNFGHEAAQCAAYYLTVSNAPGLSNEVAKKLKETATSLTDISRKATNDELTLARTQLEVDTIARDMHNSWANVSIINNKYGYRCKDLAENPAGRFRYWLDKED